jgi:putative oxidoreductase
MNIILWVIQVLLAAAFLAHGVFLLIPPASMVEAMNATMSTSFRVFLGVAEALAGIGLILPGLTRILPWMISWAAAGIMIVMISATVFHLMRGEISSAITTAILLAMAAFVAYMRWKVKPILPRPAV